MVGNFPEVDIPDSLKTDLWAKQFIDAAVSFYETSSKLRNQTLQGLYDSHNGIIKEVDKKFIVEKYGAKSVVPYTDFKLGRTKIKLLLGEYLLTDFDPIVSSVNPEAISQKVEKAKPIRGAMFVKEELARIEQITGLKPLGGVKIPNPTDPDLFTKLYPKTKNEVIMQTILDGELADGKIKLIGYNSLGDVIITSECHARIGKDTNGKEVIELINPKQRIFQESPNDPFNEKTPFSGHVDYLYPKDILQKFNLKEEDKVRLKSAMSDPGHEDRKAWHEINGIQTVPVYFIQWKTVTPEYIKVSPSRKGGPDYLIDISEDEYNKGKDKFKTIIKYREKLWGGVRIGQTIYTDIKKVDNQIQTRNFLGKYRSEYDYVSFLFGTIDGVRMSLQELTNGLSQIYNIVMYQIVREIRKMKGKVFTYDESLRPKLKTMKSVLYDLEEHSVIRFSSSSEQNYGAVDVDNAVQVIRELDLGLSQSFKILLEVKYNIENTIDKITGINENREGMGKASQTATGANQSIEQSRSITKDLFFCHNLFMQELLRKLLEKRKTNWEWIDSMSGSILLGEMYSQHLKITRDITNDDYGVVLSDGRKEQEIRQKAERYFDAEINSGNLRTKDVIAFSKTRNLNAGLQVLEDAWVAIQKVAQLQLQSKEKIAQQSLAAQRQMSIEDREDWQAHETDLARMKLGEAQMKLAAQGVMKDNANETNENISQQNNESL
ncbi:MAG: hypothetical protein WC222_11280 [Parachlamydiales bacterium]|jgi:hypothetical protein